MKVVALISGGKDSCFNMMHVVAEGHKIVALANLYPQISDSDELDSYMFQTVGHEVIEFYAEALELPLYRRRISRRSKLIEMDYIPDSGDEVEDLYDLLKEIQDKVDFDAVSSGAILSDYQRVRVESVCSRLGLTSLSYLWRQNQEDLLQKMIDCNLEAVITKTAALGLDPYKHLGKSLQHMQPLLRHLNMKYGSHICGEGGEFETSTLDCPLFKKRIVIDESEVVIHSDDAFAPVGYLKLKKMHLEGNTEWPGSSWSSFLNTSVQWENAYIDSLRHQELEIDGIDENAMRWTEFSKPVSNSDNPQAYSSGQYLTISNLTGYCADENPGEEMIKATALQVLEKLKGITEAYGHCLSDVVYAQLHVAEMSHYKFINAVYSNFFPLNPPSRTCIGVGKNNVSRSEVLRMYCMSRHKPCIKKSMHVQGISHWAPANIGPFSQCVQIDNTLYISGTIGLIPSSMNLIKGGAYHQASLGLRHVESVITAMESKASLQDLAWCVCYVTRVKDIKAGMKAWKQTLSGDYDIVYLVVNELPKQALAEWQGIAYLTSGQDSIFREKDVMNVTLEDATVRIHTDFTRMNDLCTLSCSMETPNCHHALDLSSCLDCIATTMQKYSAFDVIQMSLFYIGENLQPEAVKHAWHKLWKKKHFDASCLQVRYIFNSFGISSCITCRCLLRCMQDEE